MKQAFKKTLLATAVAAVSASALASDILINDPKGVNTDFNYASGLVDPGTVGIELGANYTQGDLISINFSGSALSEDSLITTSFKDDTGADTTDVQFGVLDVTSDRVLLRVTNLAPNFDTENGTLVVGGFDFDVADVARAGAITVGVESETSTGVSFDTFVPETNKDYALLRAGFQLTGGVGRSGRFSKTVDITADREEFTDGTTTDSVFISISSLSGVLTDDFRNYRPGFFFDSGEFANYNGADVVVSGDFSWVEDSDEETEGLQPAAGTFTASCPSAASVEDLEVAADAVSWSCSGTWFTGSAGLTVDFAQGQSSSSTVIPASSDYTASFTAAVQNGTRAQTSATSFAGAFDLNGSQAFVGYMPYGPNISQILYVTNNSSVAGEITVDIYDENGEEIATGVNAGMATANGVTKITGPVEAAVGDYNGKVRMDITVNAPVGQVEVYSAYNVGGSDRGLVINSTNKTDVDYDRINGNTDDGVQDILDAIDDLNSN